MRTRPSPLTFSESPFSDDPIETWVATTVQAALAYARTLVANADDAEDIVHDCYRRLLARAIHYDLPRDGTRLLYKAITNASINWSQRRKPAVSLDQFSPHAGATLPVDDRVPAPVDVAIRQELEEAVGLALAELPAPQRAAIELRSLGHSLVEVAEILSVSHAHARVLLHRARQSLATRLQPFLKEKIP